MENINFVEDTKHLIVIGSPLLKVIGAVKLIQDGKVVASIDGTYDFTNVPKEHHETIFNLIQQLHGPMSLYLPSTVPVAETKVYKKVESDSLMNRIKRRWKNERL